MNNKPYKKPTPEVFQKLVNAKGGNLTKVAEALGVARCTIWDWMKQDSAFERIVKDERAKLYDECLVTARTVAMGLPAYEVDDNGVKKFAGWIEKPDPNMLRYFMSTLGKAEGFGDSNINDDGTVKEGVSIKAWIMKQNEGDTSEGGL